MNLSGVFLPWASLIVSLAVVASYSINSLEFALKIQALRAGNCSNTRHITVLELTHVSTSAEKR